MDTYVVKSLSTKGILKTVTLISPSGRESKHPIHRYALLGDGDRVTLQGSQQPRITLVNVENGCAEIPVTPKFSTTAERKIGEISYTLRIQEPASNEDFQALHYLQQFHYRTQDSSSAGGRKAVLLASIRFGKEWLPAGYIELHMPLMMCKPRHAFFDSGFTHSKRPISWDKWNQTSIREYVNLIVRVARVVTHPEYRGLALSRVMLSEAKKFASERWHIGGRKPIMMEISAEMLRYIDFVSSSGFEYIDQTEGNAHRLVPDLRSMLRGQKIDSGIMTLQKKYLESFKTICDSLNQSFEKVLKRLETVLEKKDPRAEMRPEEWLAFRKIIRYPIPYYLCGLDLDAISFIRQRNESYSRKFPLTKSKPVSSVSPFEINISGLTLKSEYRAPTSKAVNLIIESFGLDQESSPNNTVLGPIDLHFSQGNIIFVSGSSGTGKTMLLRSVDRESNLSPLGLKRQFSGKYSFKTRWLAPIRSHLPIFEYFSTNYGTDVAFSVLSRVGLSEARVFIRPFDLLSKGQQYRAMLAELMLGEEEVWLLDEFCADLDPTSARIVAHNLRNAVIHSKRIAFVAAANYGHFLDALRPTKVIDIRFATPPVVKNFSEIRNELYSRHV